MYVFIKHDLQQKKVHCDLYFYNVYVNRINSTRGCPW
jgi:hypothetical protein